MREERIEPQIKGLLNVLKISLNPQSNTRLPPVEKPDDCYRLPCSLRAVNEGVEGEVTYLSQTINQGQREITSFTGIQNV